MSAAVVRCPSCEQPSRVPTAASGLVVACPRCQYQFVADPLPPPSPSPPPPPPPARPKFSTLRDDVPVVHPVRRPPVRPAANPDDVPTVHPQQTLGGPIALALLPVGVPLLWLILTLAVGESQFSFMAAVAIAAGTVGLGLGLACIRRWSAGLRVKLLLVHVALTYAAAALFYFAPQDWLVQAREVAAVTGLVWREFKPEKQEDQTFQLLVPGEPQESVGPVPEWKLTARQFVDDKNAVDLYVVAYGDLPAGLGKRLSDDAWFDAARDAVAAACKGELLDGDEGRGRVVTVLNGKAREYQFKLPAGRERVVRLVRTDAKLYYLAVEGPFLQANRADVQRYMGSFRLTPAPKRK